MLQKLNVWKTILLTVCTFGLYGIFWFIALTDEMNLVTNSEKDAHGIKAWVLCIVTLGLYGIYWAYKMGEKVDILKKTKGSTGILYAVLQFFFLGVVVYALAQDALNKYA